ncbi:uncharacterized protein LOC127810850 [Diospyros lotus]|uniref:uncharacterized protein LOC127810850 n=1 Tax=Diospyros lotus TaxID=55363 RepID=UPI00225A063E|nr:uncharacterized protein LOC127810850 [Diospyros lotus]
MKASSSKHIEASLPEDIALKIVSSLPVLDVCSLGSCSRFWRELCGSDSVWAFLCKDRWPALKDSSASEIKAHELHPQIDSLKGWKGLYISKHNEMAARSTIVVNFVKQCSPTESIEVGHYLAAIEILWSMQFGFKDVQMFLLKPNLDVLLNLVGLHYCINWLEVPAECLIEALNSCKIEGRKVRVQWWKLGRWSYGFRLQDETHSRNISLEDFAMAKEEEVLGVLRRGAIYEVRRVQISVAKPTRTLWSCQTSQAPT